MVENLFPRIEGINLKNQKLIIPDNFIGKFNILLLPFKRSNELYLQKWLSFLNTLVNDIFFIEYYNLRPLKKNYRFMKKMTDKFRYKKYKDDRDRGRTGDVFLVDPLNYLSLGIDDEKEIYIFLLTRNGNILWRSRGDYNLTKAQEIKEVIIQNIGK